ncbi:MAG: DUF2125 domain-containing protein [Phaeovulum sp.]|uniref:DUF2125 domain-containing protein n=1 Tax=Phaeovulum sp. TaxID=2934796 RepID=UPI002731A269|nr:DUF2125 domain-containing protein [Phaeovulum sp.]MDP2062184.1 DUF2125 domain-containing protein [Phaeovulum sp.]MDP3862818.1 DUF2125 domain-containing protein [Phaeovulum sp.]
MAQWKTLGAGTALSLLLGSTAALADVTAQDVWKAWTESLAGFGYTFFTTSETVAGDTLVVKDVVMSMTRPEGTFDMNVAEIRLQETGDGKVTVTMSNDIPIWATTTAEGVPPVNTTMMLRQQDLTMIVSGVPENMAYDVSATEMMVEGSGADASAPETEARVAMTLREIEGAYTLDTMDGNTITSEFAAASLDFTASGVDPETSGLFDMTGSIADVASSFSAFLPADTDMNDMAAAIAAGFYGEGEMTYGAGRFAMNFADESGPGSVESTGEGGLFHFSLSGDGLEYGADGGAATVMMTAPDLPFPVSFSKQSSTLLMSIPIAKAERLQNFAVKVGIAGLAVSEELWGMVDPMAQLPRTPAEFLIDISGSAKLLVNLFDPAEVEANPIPGELQDMALNALRLAAAGADLSGTGAFTFNNDMGFPMPKGAVDLRLVGAYALMDKLTAMGLLPSEQSAGFRAMLGLFAVPVGADELTSKIEMREDGGIYANGQRLQ